MKEMVDGNKYTSYFSLFDGKAIPLSQITEDNSNLRHTVGALIKSGKVVGQGIFNEDMSTDILIYMPDRKQEVPLFERKK